MHFWSCDITKYGIYKKSATSQPIFKIETSGLDHKIFYIYAQSILVFWGDQEHFFVTRLYINSFNGKVPISFKRFLFDIYLKLFINMYNRNIHIIFHLAQR